MEVIKQCKIWMVGCFALYFTLVVFNNITDYSANFGFVSNVLSMSDTFTAQHDWRAISNSSLHHIAYWVIIATEFLIALLLWTGVISMWRKKKETMAIFQESKKAAIIGLTIGFSLWFLAFISIGGEWYLMWQSETWNGNPTAFRNATLILLGLIFISLPENLRFNNIQ